MEQDFKWWEARDAHYDRMIDKWRYVRTVYEMDPDVIRTARFILRKKQGEAESNHEERMKLAKCVGLFPAVIDGYAGLIGQAEEKISRTLGEYLGIESDRESIAGQVWDNADGAGKNYLPLLSDAATELMLMQGVWGFVDGKRRRANGEAVGGPSIRVLPVESVPITIWDEGRMVAAVVKHEKTIRASVFDKPENEERYTIYALDGHATYTIKEDEAGKRAERVDGGNGDDTIPYGPNGFRYMDGGQAVLPIFYVSMPGRRYPAYSLAHQNITYINHASELQNKHRSCNVLKVQVVASDKNERDAQEAAIKAGTSILWIAKDAARDNKYVEPSANSLAETRQWLAESRGEFLISALRQYEDSIKGVAKTATEAGQDAARGEYSYLNALAGALDEFESQAWRRIEQVAFPGNPDRWGQFSVYRKRDFKPLDEQEYTMRLKSTYFAGDRVPIGAKGRESAAIKIADADGLEYDADELSSEVNAQAVAAARQSDIFGELGVTP